MKTSDITLERGRFDPLMLDWVNEVRAGSVQRKSVSIIFVDRSGAQLARFNLDGAWPAAYAADVGVEQITFAVEEVKPARK